MWDELLYMATKNPEKNNSLTEENLLIAKSLHLYRASPDV